MIYLPLDIIHKINKWHTEFIIIDSIERIRNFKDRFDTCWKEICYDIRTNTPSYEIRVTNYQGLKIILYLRLPDCDIENFDARAIFNSWEYVIFRKALPFPR